MLNKKGTSIMEVLSMLPVVIGLVGWSVWFGIETSDWFWCITMGIIMLVVGVMEIISTIKDDKTISQKFWKYSKENKTKAIIMLIMMQIGWIFLLTHLGWKMITGE